MYIGQHSGIDSNGLLILGAGGHAKTLIDLVRQTHHYSLIGLVADPLPPTPDVLGVPVLGGEELLPNLHEQGFRLIANGVGSPHRNRTRQEIFVRLADYGFTCPTLVHSRAAVEPSAVLGPGVQVLGMAFVGSHVRVGFGAIVNLGAIASHDCVIGDFAHVAAGAVLSGCVEVGTGALIGAGASVASGVKIGEWAQIGMGAQIEADVPPNATIEAGITWPGLARP